MRKALAGRGGGRGTGGEGINGHGDAALTAKAFLAGAVIAAVSFCHGGEGGRFAKTGACNGGEGLSDVGTTGARGRPAVAHPSFETRTSIGPRTRPTTGGTTRIRPETLTLSLHCSIPRANAAPLIRRICIYIEEGGAKWAAVREDFFFKRITLIVPVVRFASLHPLFEGPLVN